MTTPKKTKKAQNKESPSTEDTTEFDLLAVGKPQHIGYKWSATEENEKLVQSFLDVVAGPGVFKANRYDSKRTNRMVQVCSNFLAVEKPTSLPAPKDTNWAKYLMKDKR